MAHQLKNIIVTGAGGGIGKAIVAKLASKGYALGLVGRRVTSLEACRRLAEQAGCKHCLVQRADVSRRTEIRAAMRVFGRNLGPIQGVIACAGISGSNHPGPHDRWEEIIGTNLSGTYYTFTEAISGIDHNPSVRKSFIVIGSLLARIGLKGSSAYCASKAGISGMVKALALEWAPLNVHVNIIHPGWVLTQMAARGLLRLARVHGKSLSEMEQFYRGQVPLRRMSDPDEIAELVSYLVSGGDQAFTGATFDPNNGVWMG